MNDFLQIRIKKFPKMRMAFYQAGNVAKVFEFLALSSFRISPRFDFSAQRVFQTSNPHKNSVYICWNGPTRKLFIEIFRAQLNTHLD